MIILESTHWSNQAERLWFWVIELATSTHLLPQDSKAHDFPTFRASLLITVDAEIEDKVPGLRELSVQLKQANRQLQYRSLSVSLSSPRARGSAPGSPCSSLLQYRHASLLRPSQFHGEPCHFSDKEVEDCVSNRPCRSQVRCEGFVCAQTGMKGVGRKSCQVMLETHDDGRLAIAQSSRSGSRARLGGLLVLLDLRLHVLFHLKKKNPIEQMLILSPFYKLRN